MVCVCVCVWVCLCVCVWVDCCQIQDEEPLPFIHANDIIGQRQFASPESTVFLVSIDLLRARGFRPCMSCEIGYSLTNGLTDRYKMQTEVMMYANSDKLLMQLYIPSLQY